MCNYLKIRNMSYSLREWEQTKHRLQRETLEFLMVASCSEARGV